LELAVARLEPQLEPDAELAYELLRAMHLDEKGQEPQLLEEPTQDVLQRVQVGVGEKT
jgi:hypothetical protein